MMKKGILLLLTEDQRKTAEEKVSGILGDNYYDAEQHLQELTDSFNLYLSKPYRYYL